MGVFSFFGAIVGWIFSFIFERIDDIFVWVLPSYMTVCVVKESQEKFYKNYLCFWILLALILGFEHVTFYLFYYMTFYRVARLLIVIWLQIDFCGNSLRMFASIQPLISNDVEKKLETVFSSVTAKIDKQGAVIQTKVSDQFWTFVSKNYEMIKNGLFSALTTASEKAVDLSKRNSATDINLSSKEPGEGEAARLKEAVQKKES